MAVFTAFFCGTGSNSFDYANQDYHSGELVSTLARHAAGIEFVDWIILDGPGSGNYQEDEKFVQPGNYSTARGMAFGAGWVENVAHAIAMIHGEAEWSRRKLTEFGYKVLKDAKVPIEDKEVVSRYLGMKKITTLPDRKVTQQQLQMQKIKIFRKNQQITGINAIGWSRGAVTTHMFANALALDDQLKNVPVNIVAVDPVPGAGNFQLNRTSIPANVANYVGFFARDERSKGFNATLPSFAKGVKTHIYPLPGRHATLVGNAGNYIGGNGDNVFFGPGKVVRMLSENYLTTWGTKLKECLNFSELEMLRCYDEMVAQDDKYKALRKQTYTYSTGENKGRFIGIGQDWTSTQFQNVDMFGSTFPFINLHHKKLFWQFGGLRNTSPNVRHIIRRYHAYLNTFARRRRRH